MCVCVLLQSEGHAGLAYATLTTVKLPPDGYKQNKRPLSGAFSCITLRFLKAKIAACPCSLIFKQDTWYLKEEENATCV